MKTVCQYVLAALIGVSPLMACPEGAVACHAPHTPSPAHKAFHHHHEHSAGHKAAQCDCRAPADHDGCVFIPLAPAKLPSDTSLVTPVVHLPVIATAAPASATIIVSETSSDLHPALVALRAVILLA